MLHELQQDKNMNREDTPQPILPMLTNEQTGELL